MAGRTTGRKAQLWLSQDVGTPVVNQALTLAASKSINDTVYANQFYGAANAIFDKSQPLNLVVQGLVGATSLIAPASSGAVDAVDVAGFQFNKDASGLQTAAATLAVAVTRPGLGKMNWNLLVVDTTTNVISAVVGTDGNTLIDTWGSAGGPPLASATQLIIGAVKLTSHTSAVVQASEITYTLSDNATLIQERSTNNFKEYCIEGGLLMNGALIPCHTGNVPRGVYASYSNLLGMVQKAVHIDDIKISGKSNTVEALAMEDTFADVDLSGPPSFDGSMGRFYVADDMMFRLAFGRRYGAFRVFPNATLNPEKYYTFCAFISSWDQSMQVSAFEKNTLAFKVDGYMKRVGF